MAQGLGPGIIVHGGAGRFDVDRHDAVREACRSAVLAGLAVLDGGGDAVEAACAAVRVLEDAPELNAGVGSVLTRAGTVELEAAVMDGRDLRFGAVAAMPDARRPIDIARAVLDDGEHVLLCADGAWAFARERGFEPCDPAELITERARRRIDEEAARRAAATPDAIDPGTVGACAIDAGGHVAAATSTGGITYKRIGRVGDTPLCGCGTYADDRGGAASATGHGESLIRVTMTRLCVDRMRAGDSADEAARAAVAELGDAIDGRGGVICVDARGRLGAAHNTDNMPVGVGRAGAGSIAVATELGAGGIAALLARS